MAYKTKSLEEVFPKKKPLSKEVIDKLKNKNLFWLWFWAIFPFALFIILSPTLKPRESYADYIFGILGIVIIYYNGRDLYRYYKYIKKR